MLTSIIPQDGMLHSCSPSKVIYGILATFWHLAPTICSRKPVWWERIVGEQSVYIQTQHSPTLVLFYQGTHPDHWQMSKLSFYHDTSVDNWSEVWNPELWILLIICPLWKYLIFILFLTATKLMALWIINTLVSMPQQQDSYLPSFSCHLRNLIMQFANEKKYYINLLNSF